MRKLLLVLVLLASGFAASPTGPGTFLLKRTATGQPVDLVYFDSVWNLGTGLRRSGDTIYLDYSGVLPGTYGDATHVPQVTIDSFGRVVNVTNVTISGGGGGGGTVTSVGLALPSSVFSISGSPVVGSGTLSGSFVNQAPNTAFMGPASTTGPPTFRAILPGDISFLTDSITAAKVYALIRIHDSLVVERTFDTTVARAITRDTAIKLRAQMHDTADTLRKYTRDRIKDSLVGIRAALPAYVRRIGDTITGPIVGTTATAAPLINITTTFGNLTNAAIRGTASASGGTAIHGVATGASGVGVWGVSTNTGGDGGLFSGTGGAHAVRAIATGGGKAGQFNGDVGITGGVLSITTTTDAPISISHNIAGGFTHPFQAFNSGMVAGNQYNFDFGQSASTNNAGNFGFKYVGAGSASNYVTLGLYGANDLLTITAAGVPKFSGLATGFVRSTSGTLSASALVAGDIPALPYQPLENQRLSTSNVPTFAGITITGPITGTTSGTSPLVELVSTSTSNGSAVIRGTSANGVGVIGLGSASGSVGVLGSANGGGSNSAGVSANGSGGSDGIFAQAVGGGLAGRFNGSVSISGTATFGTSLTGFARLTSGVLSASALTASDIPTLNQNTTGSAAKWTTPRTLTIGATGKAVDGSANVSWSLAEIGAFALAGGTLNSGAQIATNKDITPSASANTNYALAPIVAQRSSNSGTTTVAAVGFHNLGVNAAALYYDAATSVFRYNRHTGEIVTIWDASNLTNLNQLANGPGYVTNSTVANVDVTEHSSNNTNYPVVWDNGARSLFHTAAKMWFNPNSGLFAATAIASGSTLSWGGGILRDYTGGGGTSAAIYGSWVGDPNNTNYSLAFAKDGSEIYMRGANNANLVVGSTVIAQATSSGLAVTGALTASGMITSGLAAMGTWSVAPGTFAWFGANNQNNGTNGNSGYLQAITNGALYACAPSGGDFNVQVSSEPKLNVGYTRTTIYNNLTVSDASVTISGGSLVVNGTWFRDQVGNTIKSCIYMPNLSGGAGANNYSFMAWKDGQYAFINGSSAVGLDVNNVDKLVASSSGITINNFAGGGRRTVTSDPNGLLQVAVSTVSGSESSRILYDDSNVYQVATTVGMTYTLPAPYDGGHFVFLLRFGGNNYINVSAYGGSNVIICRGSIQSSFTLYTGLSQLYHCYSDGVYWYIDNGNPL